MDFKTNLKALRLKKEYTQEQIAFFLNITRLAYSKYEQGLREPKYIILEKIKEILKCSYDDLLK